MEDSDAALQNSQDTSKKNRRAILKGTIAGVGTGALIGKLGANEIFKHHHGIVTEQTIFHPIYEIHSETISAADIPENLNGLYFEGLGWFGVGDPAISLKDHSNFGNRMFPDDVLEKLARNNTQITIGDLDTSTSKTDLVFGGIEGVVGFKILKESMKQNVGQLPRRQFVKNVGKIAGVWGMSSLVGYTASIADLAIQQERNSAINRILERVNGMISNLHPEQTSIFFRNIKFALCMFSASEVINSDSPSDTKPQIAYIVGKAHAGVEDLLQAGPEFCKKLLLAYPKVFLDEVERQNPSGAIYSTMIINLPTDFKADDLDDRAKSSHISQKFVVDNELKKRLQHKLGRDI
jgi:hypothetical protein